MRLACAPSLCCRCGGWVWQISTWVLCKTPPWAHEMKRHAHECLSKLTEDSAGSSTQGTVTARDRLLITALITSRSPPRSHCPAPHHPPVLCTQRCAWRCNAQSALLHAAHTRTHTDTHTPHTVQHMTALHSGISPGAQRRTAAAHHSSRGTRGCAQLWTDTAGRWPSVGLAIGGHMPPYAHHAHCHHACAT